MATNKLTIDIVNMPEMLFAIRREMSKLLREEAESEADPRIARRLRELADRFEAGA